MASRAGHASHVWLFAFVDVLLVLTMVLCAFTFLALPQINPPANDNPLATKPPGNIAVMLSWPQGDEDIDLWLDAPGQKIAVGYSNKSGPVWSLLRDDLGNANDTTPLNAEAAFARTTPPGEYTINAHAYNAPGPTTVHVEVALNGRLLVNTDMVLKPKQERTVIRFTLDGNGEVVSSNKVFKPLRSARK